MIQEGNISSQEKLLKLIRKSDRDDSRKNKGAKDGFNAGDEEQGFSSKEFDLLAFLNVFFLVLVFVLVVIVFFNFFPKEEENFAVSTTRHMRQVDFAAEGKMPEPLYAAFGFYEDFFDQKDIFEHPWEKIQKEKEQERLRQAEAARKQRALKQEVVKKEPKEKNKVENIIPLEKRIKVVGIILAHNPQAVVEVFEKKETVFLSPGDKVLEAEVKEIRENKIVFLYHGEEVELGQ